MGSAEHGGETQTTRGWWVLVGHAGWLSTGTGGEDEEVAAPPVLEEPCPN